MGIFLYQRALRDARDHAENYSVAQEERSSQELGTGDPEYVGFLISHQEVMNRPIYLVRSREPCHDCLISGEHTKLTRRVTITFQPWGCPRNPTGPQQRGMDI